MGPEEIAEGEVVTGGRGGVADGGRIERLRALARTAGERPRVAVAMEEDAARVVGEDDVDAPLIRPFVERRGVRGCGTFRDVAGRGLRRSLWSLAPLLGEGVAPTADAGEQHRSRSGRGLSGRAHVESVAGTPATCAR
nr:hypothetical protein [Halarchaeum acidiphilum]